MQVEYLAVGKYVKISSDWSFMKFHLRIDRIFWKRIRGLLPWTALLGSSESEFGVS